MSLRKILIQFSYLLPYHPSFGSKILLSTQQNSSGVNYAILNKMCNFNVRQIALGKQSCLKLEAKHNQIKSDVRACVCVCVFLGIDLMVMQSDWKSF